MKTTVDISPVNMDARKQLDLRAGDTVRVHQKIQEKGKTRIQIFEGLILAVKHGKEAGGTFTVRKIASGVGVEKIYPIYSPNIEKVDIVKRSKVRQSKLYHIREKAAKAIRREMRNIRALPDAVDEAQMNKDLADAKAKAEDEAQAAEAAKTETVEATETPAEEAPAVEVAEAKTEEVK